MIRPAFIEDLPRLEALAREFYATSKHLKDFDPEKFVALWTGLLHSGKGAIFLIVDVQDNISGALGGLAYPEQYSNRLVAQEFFWFVHSESRGEGVRLYRPFERWAELMGCTEVRMGYLVDVMPEKVQHFYERMGFHRVEVNYAKELPCAG